MEFPGQCRPDGASHGDLVLAGQPVLPTVGPQENAPIGPVPETPPRKSNRVEDNPVEPLAPQLLQRPDPIQIMLGSKSQHPLIQVRPSRQVRRQVRGVLQGQRVGQHVLGPLHGIGDPWGMVRHRRRHDQPMDLGKTLGQRRAHLRRRHHRTGVQ